MPIKHADVCEECELGDEGEKGREVPQVLCLFRYPPGHLCR